LAKATAELDLERLDVFNVELPPFGETTWFEPRRALPVTGFCRRIGWPARPAGRRLRDRTLRHDPLELGDELDPAAALRTAARAHEHSAIAAGAEMPG
jgi:hypothetical protein